MSSGDNYVADGPAAIGWNDRMGQLEVSLPHQCDEWMIGDADAVRVMIADLTALLPEFERPEKYRHEHVCATCGAEFFGPGGACVRPCSAIYNDGLCGRCSANQWHAKARRKDEARRQAEQETLRSFPGAGVE